jgi:hypothetical protein
MNSTPTIIKDLKKKISKFERDFKRGVPPYQGFTIDISYGGNKENDIERVTIGSVYHVKEMGETFYNLVLDCMKQSLEQWKKTAQSEIQDLYKCLEDE